MREISCGEQAQVSGSMYWVETLPAEDVTVIDPYGHVTTYHYAAQGYWAGDLSTSDIIIITSVVAVGVMAVAGISLFAFRF